MPAIQNSPEVEARGSEVQGFLWLQRDFEDSLKKKKKGCPDSKQNKNSKEGESTHIYNSILPASPTKKVALYLQLYI